jgi:thioesterase domain-containing protein/acyl carrier protein
MYGITETTVHVTYRPLTSADVKSGSVIGIPIPDLKVYILDRNGQLAPLGVPGELYVGGAGVARGYLKRPELTAERFVVDPFTTKQGSRLYRSGDLARYLPNRDLEYLGRIDDQVKIRGFRIELGEIESVLAGLPEVREALVVAREDVPGERRLVAYLTTKTGERPKDTEMRGLLQATLPEYMVPSAFVTLERFPLTPNGKVDRKALPRPDFQAERAGFVPPASATEKALANIWAEVLGIKQVGLHDNFFELGGHSLQTLRVVTAIHKQLGKTVQVGSLFTAPTILQLSRLLDESANGAVVAASGGLRGKGSGAPLIYIPGLQGYEFLPRGLARHLNERCRYYDGLQYPGLHDGEAMPDSVEEIAAYLIPQIQRIWPHGPYYLTGWSFGGAMAFEVARQMEAQGVKVQLVMLLDSRCPRSAMRKRSVREIVDLFRRHLSNLNRLERAVFFRDLVINKLRFLSYSIRWRFKSKPKKGTNPLAQATLQAARKYNPGCYEGRVVLFQIEDWEFYSGFRFAVDPDFGWEEWCRGGLEVVRVPGDHLSMMNEPAVTKVAERILSRLAQDESEQSTAWSRAGSQPLFKPA